MGVYFRQARAVTVESGWASDPLFLPLLLIHDFTPPRYTSLGTLSRGGGEAHCRCRPDEHDGELRQQAAERRSLPPHLQRQEKWLRKESLLVPRAAEVSPPEGEGKAHPSNGDEGREGRERTPPVACARPLAWCVRQIIRTKLSRNCRSSAFQHLGVFFPPSRRCVYVLCEFCRAANVIAPQLKCVTLTNMAGK